jgi:integrase
MAPVHAERKQASFRSPIPAHAASKCGTLPLEQIRIEPSLQGGGFEKMARRRYQKPTPKKRGNQWSILVREEVVEDGQRKRKLKRISLGPVALTRAEAERLRDDYLATINQAHVGIGGAILFRDFARIYERDVLPTVAATTRSRSKSVLKKHLNPEFGNLMLREVASLELLQGYFRRLEATDQSGESVDKIKDVLSAVLRTAVDYCRLATNPVEKVRIRKRKITKPKPFLRLDQFNALLELIAEPYATMVYVAIFTALRVSELAGLDRIERLKSVEITIRAGRGCRKYKAVKVDGPDDQVFQSVVKGAPMRDNNILTRHLKPAGRKLGIPWVNWQVLRRSSATWMGQAELNVKDAQGLMRHSRASTTQDVYQQVVPESQRQAVQKLTAFARPVAKEALALQ